MLKINDLHLSINKLEILKGISLDVNAGETVGLIGPNGSGKTTLFNSISGFHTAQTGTIVYKDSDITKLKAFRRSKLGIGRVFQNFGVFREISVLENVQIALESRQAFIQNLLPWSRQNKKNKEEALTYLEEVGLSEKANQKVASLSGGQMRLLEIIRTLAFGAELFLLDEPTAGVSPKMKMDIAAIIKDLKKLKKTIIIIEHDINFIQNFCDRIVVLDNGQVVLDDNPENVKSSDKLREIYLGT